ncbi:DNA polymerase IV [Myxococcota bacterium]|nr:DNA polymerase IV [Myxococcota bacterium]
MSGRAILHVDMDAFYASVEQRDDASLRGKPVIVGGHPTRGVVLAASYEVRPFGVKSAMPMARATKLAPNAIVVPPRFEAYAEASEGVHAIFERFTPLIEPLSLDEAFLDVTGSQALFGTGAEIATKIRRAIAEELSLPASAGIAEMKFVAKIASDFAKPNGQQDVPAGTSKAFLAPLPIWRLWGVGPKTEERLKGMGLETIGDVAKRAPDGLERELGDTGLHLWNLANAIDPRPVIPDREAKSIGAEDTFEDDLGDFELLSARIHSQAIRVARRMRKAKVRARVVVLKIKLSDFELRTRRTTLPEPTDDARTLREQALELLRREWPLPRRVRLTGVSAHDLTSHDGQLPLFDGPSEKATRLNATLDRIASKFGTHAVLPADVASLEPREGLDEIRARAGASRLDAAMRHGRAKHRGGE